ncbi:hypothetical protein DFH06DRAFT_1199792 [Mycena polygramma]|nr:hypothetical protein DFH06DRAFT_1199792 [Mycena polygramma]
MILMQFPHKYPASRSMRPSRRPASMSESAQPVSIPSLDGTLGALEIGAILGTFLLGVSTLQTFNYFRQFPKDSKFLKTVVAVVWILEVGHSICIWYTVYSLTVTFYAQPAHLAKPPHSMAFQALFTALIIPFIQSFFAYRIRVLSGQWTITIICSILSFARFVFGLMGCGLFYTASGFAALRGGLVFWATITTSSLGIAVDFITASSLCYLLWKIKRSGTHFVQTRKMLDGLIFWTIETTLITSITGLLQLVFFRTRADLVWGTFYLIQTKLFSNSMLASLNNRQSIRAGQDNVLSLGSAGAKQSNVVIQMHRITETTNDMEMTPKNMGSEQSFSREV